MDQNIVTEFEALSERLADAKIEITQHIIGQDLVVEQAMSALLSGGHALLVGLPGLGKTRLVDTMGTVMGLKDRRIQFTPDLMPADILGAEVLEESDTGARHFRFVKGPVFCQLLLADEINRASPRTQSALLQAMQESEVSVAGHTHSLPEPFHVLATQNPLEQEGTYPLPEAQLDRFLMQINVDYPARADERAILLATTGEIEATPKAVLTSKDLIRAQELIRLMPVGESVVEMILDLVRSCRPDDPASPEPLRQAVSWGPGPRAAQALMLLVRARAALDGRFAPEADDVRALAHPVLSHRMALGYGARAEGVMLADLIDSVLAGMEQAA
ncbi:MoxR family ATPase [Aliiroseovarius sp. KMU-50]|uniref:MoxR family ATPase n=1 Tax=Aliiroseovarius salicola TaxID=3009082 RepID=A0ABT4VZ76_9RHOB|nr:MoxR family ATPase [Aliiroseovarius sp. KMU-50]MDA5093566.1 MoxR family ATPase [Aliiroseovarius sp. KMU-50]